MKIVSANPISERTYSRPNLTHRLSEQFGRQTERLTFIISGLIGWMIFLSASYWFDMMIVGGLVVSALFIIWCVIMLRFIQPTGTEWIKYQSKI